MIDYNNTAARKQVAADLMASLEANRAAHPEPDAPTVILDMARPTLERVNGKLKDTNEPYRAWHYGFWSRCNLGDRRWFWVARAYGKQCPVDWVVYGFAESETQAVADAHQTITEDFPAGFCFRWGSAGGASDTYADHFAKKTWFAPNWRKRFPLWAHQTHLYHYDDSSDALTGEPREGTLRIVAVTNDSVYVYLPPFAGAEPGSNFDMQRILTRDCIAFGREALETVGQSIHPTLLMVCYVESQLFERAAHAASVRLRVDELRRTMQKEHPDKGGDVQAFMTAQQEYKRLRRDVGP